MATEKEWLSKAFKDADRTGAGCFSRMDLIKVFQGLDDWTEDDLHEMFDAFDTKQDGTVSYAQLLEWVLGDHDHHGREGREDSDADDAVEMELLDDIAEEIGLDLDQCVMMEQFSKLMRAMDMCEDEAEHIYRRVMEDLKQQGQSVDGGIPLLEFLDDLQIDSEDLDALHHVKQAIDKMSSGEIDGAAKSTFAADIAIDKIARVLDHQQRSPEDSWDIAMNSPELSAAGRRLIQEMYPENKAALTEAVKVAQVSPPLIPAAAGQESNAEQCRAKVDEIIQSCRAKIQKFTDPEFNVLERPNEVLYVDKEKPGFDCTVAAPAAWKRLSDLFHGVHLFKGGISAGDIQQGQIGTCFLLGAMGAVAGNSSRAIEKLFIKYDVAVGVYGVRFCVHGEWVFVIVDDYVPVDTNDRILYAHSKDGGELWVSLVEKAFCKLYNCYEMCDGGRPMEAIFNLFGGVSGKVDITDMHKDNPAAYFKVLKAARQRGWLLTTTFVIPQLSKAGGGKCGEAVLPTGLVGGHVYSVLKVVEAYGVQLVKCRNPWGTGEWKGKYSDKNAHGEWTQELQEATGYLGRDDGCFWMTIEDFVANSGGVEYARTFGPDWKKVTHHKRFQVGALQATANWTYTARSRDELSMQKGATLEVLRIANGWWYGNVLGNPETKGSFPGNYVRLLDRPVVRFDLLGVPTKGSAKPVRVVLSFMQPNIKMMRRWKLRPDGLNYKDVAYPAIQLIVVGPDDKAVLKKSGNKHRLSGEIQIREGGCWRIYALSTAGTGGEFSLRAYVKDGTISLREVNNAKVSEIADELASP